ncbi:hypothetical protein K9M48_03880 [Candidatus Gracilibacteria bacterium]|nr:hypothetical protein [Candidatus Gracilibacteria bacterium]
MDIIWYITIINKVLSCNLIKVADPIINQKTNKQEADSNNGVFGGGEDIFDSEELFHSMENKKQNLDLNDDKILDDFGEAKDENGDGIVDIDFNKEDDKKTENDDKFDPFDVSEEGDESVNDVNTVDSVDSKNNVSEEVVVEQESVNSVDEEVQEQSQNIKDKNQNIEEIENDEIIEDDNAQEDEVEEVDDEASDEQKIEYEPETKSDLIKKFEELVEKVREVFEAAKLGDDENLEIIGGDNGISKIIYNLWLIKSDDESVLIKKTETNNDSQEEEENSLEFQQKGGYLQIILDEHLLYNEEDIVDDENKKMQIIDKLNKFIFLVGEELKIYEREKKEKERMEQEKRKLRDIFRNF